MISEDSVHSDGMMKQLHGREAGRDAFTLELDQEGES